MYLYNSASTPAAGAPCTPHSTCLCNQQWVKVGSNSLAWQAPSATGVCCTGSWLCTSRHPCTVTVYWFGSGQLDAAAHCNLEYPLCLFVHLLAAEVGCPVGTFKAPASSDCEPCPKGQYSEGGYPYPKKCDSCPKGTSTPGRGSYSIDQCGKQQQLDHSSSSSSSSC